MFYTHMGIPPIALGTLGVFSLLHRRYLPGFLAIAAISLLAFAPWFARVYVFHDWFTHPLEEGVYGAIAPGELWIRKITWLQFVSFTMVVIVARAFRGMRWKEQRNQILLIAIIASLPMLFSYGGRFYTHSLHLWSILAAGIFTPFLRSPVRPRRIVTFALLALTPTAGIVGTGTPIPPGEYPAPSAWIIAPVIASGLLNKINDAQPPGYITWREASDIAAYVDEVTAPGQPIYFQGDRDLALVVEWLADRPIDIGAWEETQPNKQARTLIDWAAKRDPHGCYVSRAHFDIPSDCNIKEIDGLYVGVRGVRQPKALKKHKNELRREKKPHIGPRPKAAILRSGADITMVRVKGTGSSHARLRRLTQCFQTKHGDTAA